MIDVSARTLRNWEKSGISLPDYKTSKQRDDKGTCER